MNRSVDVHPAWLPPEAFAPLGSRRVLVAGSGHLVDTVIREVTEACEQYGGTVAHDPGTGPDDVAAGQAGVTVDPFGVTVDPFGVTADLVLALTSARPRPGPVERLLAPAGLPPGAPGADLGPEGFLLARTAGVTVVLADAPPGLLYGMFHVVRLGEQAFGDERRPERHVPAMARRMLDHWDNVDVHPTMGQVERGYAGGSLFWDAGRARREPQELERVRDYARLLASTGINAVALNNVNVRESAQQLLGDRLDDVVVIAQIMRDYGIRVHLAVSFAAPITLGGLPTADPCDDAVRRWWEGATARVYEAVPDFGGYLVKADSEGQPGPFAYGRGHAEGANLLADALAAHGGVVHWRAFVYNHRQDWRDRSTDRARAAYDHFAPLDGQFRDTVILQVKNGPMDFQIREPVSPVIAAMPRTAVAVEFQVTQEYTGQQRHVCYLAEPWSEVLDFAPWGPGRPRVAQVAAGGGGIVAVSNVGDDPYWTGHPLAQANLYAFGRLAWDPGLDPGTILDEWIDLTFTSGRTGDPPTVRRVLHAVMDHSAQTYEQYTAPLGVGFMVRPGHHYGPDVDGYEYTAWGTYHFADRDGVGVDRTRATGTGFTGQYPQPWQDRYESLDTCPDELVLFFHHVPYGHVLHSGSAVVQHIYDSHSDGAHRVEEMARAWNEPGLDRLVGPALHARVADRLREQVRSAREWRDQVNTYFFRKSGIGDLHDRVSR